MQGAPSECSVRVGGNSKPTKGNKNDETRAAAAPREARVKYSASAGSE